MGRSLASQTTNITILGSFLAEPLCLIMLFIMFSHWLLIMRFVKMISPREFVFSPKGKIVFGYLDTDTGEDS